jgi:hypothetical protein
MSRRVLSLLLLLAGAGCERPSDEQVLRRTFAVPRVARLVSIDSSPKSAGTFGREGLSIDALFAFGPDELAAYRVRLEKDPTWRPLPPPAPLLRRLPRGTEIPLDATNGVWACRTAGDDVLHARKSDCLDREGPLSDCLFAILDFDRRTLRIRVKTAY